MGSLFFLHACTLFRPASSPSSVLPPISPLVIEELPEPVSNEISPSVETKSEPNPATEQNIQGNGSKQKYGFGVLMTTDGTKPDVPLEYKRIFNQNNGLYVVPTQEKKVYMTFDLGSEFGFTDALLDTLNYLDIPATFFLLGQYIEKNPDIVKRIAQDGFAIGNHSYYHESIPVLSEREIIEDTRKCQTLFQQLTNRDMQFYRFPRGEFSEFSLSIIHKLGYKSIFWSIAYRDWETIPGGQDECYRKVIDHIHPGAIVLMHVVTDDNRLALPKIVQTLREQGYTFAGLDEL